MHKLDYVKFGAVLAAGLVLSVLPLALSAIVPDEKKTA